MIILPLLIQHAFTVPRFSLYKIQLNLTVLGATLHVPVYLYPWTQADALSQLCSVFGRYMKLKYRSSGNSLHSTVECVAYSQRCKAGGRQTHVLYFPSFR